MIRRGGPNQTFGVIAKNKYGGSIVMLLGFLLRQAMLTTVRIGTVEPVVSVEPSLPVNGKTAGRG
jgi:hypothetical protein